MSAGMAMYDTMQFVNADVVTIVTGLAASMGSILLMGGCKGKRYALPNSEVLIHQPLGGVQGQATEIEITARHILKTKTNLKDLIAERTGQDPAKVEQDMDRDYWMTAEEAKAYGCIDEIMMSNKALKK